MKQVYEKNYLSSINHTITIKECDIGVLNVLNGVIIAKKLIKIIFERAEIMNL